MDKKKLAVIHIVKKELSLSDEEYRNILERVAGVRSSRDLTDSQFQKLMRYFVRTMHYRVTGKGITFRQKYYIKQLKKDLGWDDSHFQNYINKYFHKSDIETYSRHDASNLIVALNTILKSYRPTRGKTGQKHGIE
ncbi:MAG: regulatory protein GemA [Candidatus Scalindua sp.]|nr:regulatory protein GemA [Candidatus Scalindua sp.]